MVEIAIFSNDVLNRKNRVGRSYVAIGVDWSNFRPKNLRPIETCRQRRDWPPNRGKKVNTSTF
uniref:Transposase n=1 Tax=Romanomermis culicivorax TaxID=13658 RepID=A0A915J498_ROMCU